MGETGKKALHEILMTRYEKHSGGKIIKPKTFLEKHLVPRQKIIDFINANYELKKTSSWYKIEYMTEPTCERCEKTNFSELEMQHGTCNCGGKIVTSEMMLCKVNEAVDGTMMYQKELKPIGQLLSPRQLETDKILFLEHDCVVYEPNRYEVTTIQLFAID